MAKKKKAAGKPKTTKTKPAKKKPAKKTAAKKKPTGAAGIESIDGDELPARHAMEPRANADGVFDVEVSKLTITDQDNGDFVAIYGARASNDKYVAGWEFSIDGKGEGRPPSVLSAEFDTAYQAYWSACDEMLGKMKQRKHDKLRAAVKLFQESLSESSIAPIPSSLAPAESNVEIKTLDRNGQEKPATEADPHDSELLDEIEALADSCKEAEAELVEAKEIVKQRKKIYEGRCVDLLRKIAERKGDADRPLLGGLDEEGKARKKSRAEEIAGREATTPVETAADAPNPAHQMDWQKTPTSELHLADVVPRLSKELADLIESSYPTMGELVDLHQQGTGKGKGIRAIVGIGPKMADAIIEIIDNWLAKVRDGWGAPAADHQDFTGDNAPADEAAPADEVDEDNEPTDVATPAEEAAIAGPSDLDLENWWHSIDLNELDLTGRVLRKLQSGGFPTVGELAKYLEEGGALDTIDHVTPDEAATIAAELETGRDFHHHLQRVKHALMSGAEPYEVFEPGVSSHFDDGLRAATVGVTSLFAEARERLGSPPNLQHYLAGFVHGLARGSDQQAA